MGARLLIKGNWYKMDLKFVLLIGGANTPFSSCSRKPKATVDAWAPCLEAKRDWHFEFGTAIRLRLERAA